MSFNPATRINVIEICGDTDSFSPFAVFQESVTFHNTDGCPDGDLQQWTAPAIGRYRIRATGAQGGGGSFNTSSNQTSKQGGLCTETGHGSVAIDLLLD